MKKLVALLLVAMMLCASMAALAESPEGYPEVVEGIDFGGAKLYIYDYWSSSSNDRKANPTEEEQAQYDYRDWIMATYNVEIEQVQKGDWEHNSQELAAFHDAPDGSLAIFIIPPDFVGGPLSNGILASWNNDLIDVHDTEKWNSAMVDFMTLGDNVYGVSSGAMEPRACLYFNKRVLENAGIDWNTIYDMQAEGTWTWEAFEKMCEQIQKDEDNDGTIDIWAMTGSNVDLYRVAVYNNGGSFFGKTDDGKLTITANSDNTMNALAWCKRMWETYAYQGEPDPETGSVQWDYYKEAWKQGFCGFYVYQTYGGFNDNSEMSTMEDEWGCVAIPVGPDGDGTLLHIASENISVIPNVYDADTTAKMTYIYKLWSDATPGYDDEDSWIQNKFDYTDDRAVLETYAMLREGEHTVMDPVLYLGSVNDVEGADYLWNLMSQTPQEMYETKVNSWEGLVEAFNNK